MYKKPFINKLISSYGTNLVIQTLSPFLTDRRKVRINQVLHQRISQVQLAVESPCDLHNALAISRSVEAFGLLHMHIISWEGKKRRSPGTMKGADHWMHVHYHHHLSGYMDQMKEQHLLIAGASVRGEITLDELPSNQPICLLFGNENRGLSEEAENQCDLLFRIPMHGMTESFNLSVSAAISLHDLLRKKRKELQNQGDLSEEEIQYETARAYIHTIGLNEASLLLQKKVSDSS